VAKDTHFLLLLPADRPAVSRLIVFLLGCMTTLAFAPFGWWWLAPVVLLPLLHIGLTVTPRDAAGHGFWFGLGLYLTGTYWIYISVHVFGNAALWIALLLMVGLALIMAAFVALAGWLTSRLTRSEPWLLVVVGPAAWVLAEWIRGWVLTGFPWMALGYGQIDSPLAGFAPVIGVYGISFLLVMSAAAVIAAVMASGARARSLAAALVIAPWLTGAILSAVDWTEPAGKAIRTTIVQAGVSQDEKWNRDKLRPIMEYYLGATRGAADSELIVWPEVAIPALDVQVESFIARVESDVRRRGQNVAFGILERSNDRNGDAQTYNSVILVGGPERQAYRKRHLVPFGEYFPVPPSVREWMRMQNLPHSDLAKGDENQPLLQAVGGVRFGVAICYEDAYGAEQLYALPEAGILVNVSNDAWFGDSIAPHQHLEIARMRSLEFGRSTVRSTNTGISAFIGPDGALLSMGRQFQPEILTADIVPRRGSTPYVAIGNWPLIGACLAVLALFWIRARASI
jgi:apolipoprotein N-acyltransferase